MDPLALIEAHAQELHALGARRIGVFGSFASESATPQSDVDVYIEFSEGMKTYDNFYAIYELLRELFGRPIDLVTDGALSEKKARLILPTVRYASLNA
jgi:predicted nucleotidyltransferase